jgi:SAM-dependent methyltransferase
MSQDYDQLAADYARHRRTHPEVLRRLLAAAGPETRVLDVGCGTGNYLAALGQAGCPRWGVEPSAEMRATAQVRAAGAEIREGRAERLDFPDGTFDLVFSVDVIHHVQDRAAHYREALRILAPGGRICTVTDSEDIIRHREPLSTYFPETVAVELGRYPTLAALRELMTAAGFTELQEETVAFRAELTDVQRYRDKAFSSLHLIPEAAFRRGLERLEADLRDKGSVPWWSRYAMLWGRKA